MKSLVKNIKLLLAEINDTLNQVPNCPTCKGTGEPPYLPWAERTWWKGREVWVCHQCNGKGKV